MRAGAMRHVITIQQASDSRTSSGSTEKTWSTYATRKARFRYLAGSELFRAQQISEKISAEVEMWHDAAVTVEMRVSFDSKLFDIKAVLPDERKRSMKLLLEHHGA